MPAIFSLCACSMLYIIQLARGYSAVVTVKTKKILDTVITVTIPSECG